MRTLFFVVLFLFMGIVSHAQDNRSKEERVPATEKGLALANKNLRAQPQRGTIFYYEFEHSKRGQTATIYKYKNTKIKRALSFMAKGERPKLA